ncbi:MAG: DEAD/DEAH box helicase [Burkholderiales bacterium]|nr:DEAD/DEAH box helicase [Burkholderiales bacterium]
MSFSKLGLATEIVRAVTEFGYTEPTAIQEQAIPAILAGGDILAGAQTGSGKTAAFTLPILHMLADKSVKGQSEGRPPIRALILVPTRELAAQVEECIIDYGKHLKLTSMVMIGGVSINPQIKALRSRVDILVATPGRLLDHISQGTLSLSQVQTLILDEADRMLDMGFIRDIKKILALLPKKRQTLLFSATFSPEIKTLAAQFLNDPVLIQASTPNTTAALITHKVHPVTTDQKRVLLAHLIKEHNWYQVLVFTRTKHGANRLAAYLVDHGLSASAIHGNKSQSARTSTLANFKDGSLQVLVATDIAARGLDIIDLPHVVNYELPNVPEDYVHRIGRTGRAGKSGDAVSLVSSDETKHLLAIEKLLRMKITSEIVEGFDPRFAPKVVAEKPVVHGRHKANLPAPVFTERNDRRPQSRTRSTTTANTSAKPNSQGKTHSDTRSADGRNTGPRKSVAALFGGGAPKRSNKR